MGREKSEHLRSGLVAERGHQDYEDLRYGSCADSWERVGNQGSSAFWVSCEHRTTLASIYVLQMVKALLYRVGEV